MCWVAQIVALYSSRNTIHLGYEVSGIYYNCYPETGEIEYFKREWGDWRAMRDNQISDAEERKESKHMYVWVGIIKGVRGKPTV